MEYRNVDASTVSRPPHSTVLRGLLAELADPYSIDLTCYPDLSPYYPPLPGQGLRRTVGHADTAAGRVHRTTDDSRPLRRPSSGKIPQRTGTGRWSAAHEISPEATPATVGADRGT